MRDVPGPWLMWCEMPSYPPCGVQRVYLLLLSEKFSLSPHVILTGILREVAEDEPRGIFPRMWHSGMGVKMKFENVIASVRLGLYVELCIDVT